MDIENQGLNKATSSVRRQSLGAPNTNKASSSLSKANDTNRRQTLSGAIDSEAEKKNDTVVVEAKKSQPRVSFGGTTSFDAAPEVEEDVGKTNNTSHIHADKTPSKSKRINLGSASSYYFKHTPKTPLEKALSQQRKLNSSMQSAASFTLPSMDDISSSPNQDDTTGNTNVTVNAAELSFLSMGASSTPSTNSSSSGSGIDLLNHSVLSDTTELTASNFVFATTSRQRLSEISLMSEMKKQETNGTEMTEGSAAAESSPDQGNDNLETTGTTATAEAQSPVKDTARPPLSQRRMSIPLPPKPTEVVSTVAQSSRRRESWQPQTLKAGGDVVMKDQQHNPDEIKTSTVDNRRLSLPVPPAPANDSNIPRRESWQPGSTSSNNNKADLSKLREMTANMKNARLLREKQRQEEETNRRLSNSTVELPAFSPLKSSEKSKHSSRRSSAATSTDLDVSKRSLDNLFDNATTTVNVTTSRPSSTMDTADMHQAIFDGLNENTTNETSVPMDVDETHTESATLYQSTSDASSNHVVETLETEQTFQDTVRSQVTPKSAASEGAKTFQSSRFSGASPASSLATTTSMALAGKDQSEPSDVGAAPQSPPASITFATGEELRAEPTSPFKFDPATESKTTTPTKIKPSPRRVPNPAATDSPARNTRSRSKQRTSVESSDTLSPPSSISKLRGTPTKPKKSPRKSLSSESLDAMSQEEEEEIAVSGKRRRDSDVTAPVNLSIDDATRNIRRSSNMSTASVLNSSLRKPGSVRREVGIRHVNFSSPEVAEYNIGSPSMNLTPMPAKKLRRDVLALQDNTVEIEADMNALLNGILPPAHRESMSELPDDSQDDPSPENAEMLNESTTQDLEANMADVLEQTEVSAVDMSMESAVSLMGAEHTVELESNMQDLLKEQPTQEAVSMSSDESSSESPPVSQEKSENATDGVTPDQTVELELDMAALLSGAGDQDASTLLMASMDASPSTIGSRRRRSSISSRRFSLAPESRLSFSPRGSLQGKDAEELDNDTVMSPAEEEVTAEEPVAEEEPVELTLTREQLLSSSNVDPKVSLPESDLLVQLCEAFDVVGMQETAQSVLGQVIEEVNTRTEPELDLHQVVSTTEESVDKFLQLQEVLSGGDAKSDIVEGVSGLIDATQKSEVSKWSSWLQSVATSFLAPLEDKEREYANLIADLNKQTVSMDENFGVLKSIASEAVERARLKSYQEQQAVIEGLEEEISDLEFQLKRSRGYLEAAATEYGSIYSTQQLLEECTTLESEMKRLQPEAESLSRKFTSTKGLHKWQPVALTDKELSFQFLGPSPSSSIIVTVQQNGDSSIKCSARVDPSIYKAAKSFCSNKFRVVSSFLESRGKSICQDVCSWSMKSAGETKNLLQNVELQLGRLEQTALELVLLHRRYKAMLTTTTSEAGFCVEVDFAGQNSTKIGATFELSRAYPFAPVDVQLDIIEGEADMDALRRLLIKNAKSGFGYLSRTCDIIAAFVVM